jgi:hypothetical protein
MTIMTKGVGLQIYFEHGIFIVQRHFKQCLYVFSTKINTLMIHKVSLHF